MSAHVRGVLTVHDTFIEYLSIHIIIESIVYGVSWYDCDANYFLMPVDVSGFLDLLAWDVFSRVEYCLNSPICGIYRSNLGVDGIVQHDHLCWAHSGTTLAKEC